MLQLLYTQESDPIPTVQEAGWVPGPVCTDDKPDILIKFAIKEIC